MVVVSFGALVAWGVATDGCELAWTEASVTPIESKVLLMAAVNGISTGADCAIG
jgi:hypothetical protein